MATTRTSPSIMMTSAAATALRHVGRGLATPKEITIHCSDGVHLAAQVWSSHHQPHQSSNNSHSPAQQERATQPRRRILCLHGWMDNCRSFYKFAPGLLSQLNDDRETELVALDFPGHGWSSHKSIDGPPTILAETAFYVAEAIQQLEWQQEAFTLIGHSMGAAVSCVYCAAFPEQVLQLVLLEGAGPLARKTHDVAKHIRQHVQRRQVGIQNMSNKPIRVYPSLEKAVETRCRTAQSFPGDQSLSLQASREMVLRGSRPVVVADADNNGGEAATKEGVQFRHDPRLQWPSLQYFTVEQTEALYQDIQCPTALLLAEKGWPFDAERHQRTLDLLQPVLHKTLPGSHHFHADPDTADAVVDEVAKFLRRPC